MKSKLIVVMLCLSVILSISANVFASDDTAIVYSVVNDGELPLNQTIRHFAIFRAIDSEVRADGLGGKQMGDNYVHCITHPSSNTYVDHLLSKEDCKRRYVVYSYSIYSNTSRIRAIARCSGTIQPLLAAIGTESLEADRWNNIQFVYDLHTKDFYFLLNGVRYNGNNLGEVLAGTDFADEEIIRQFRIVFDTKNVVLAYDDVSCYVSDIAPDGFEYGSVTEPDGYENNSGIIVGGAEPVEISSIYDYKVCKNGTDEWIDDTYVSPGDVIMVEKPYYAGIREYYKTYRYIACVKDTVYNEVASQSTLKFYQGGSPLDSKGNSVQDTRKKTENIFASGLTMEFVGVGINNSNSCQTYYYTEWKKAKTFTEKYLVFETDFAFLLSSSSVATTKSFDLSTNGGTLIGSRITDSKFFYRVNHYLWVYNAQRGTYSEYINGDIYTKDIPVTEKFRNGTATSMRFSVNGNTEPSNADKTKLYGGYVANMRIYECNTHPEIKKPSRAIGEKFNTLPITDDKITVAKIKKLFSDGNIVAVCRNRDYIPVTSDTETVNACSGIIITEKDGIYNYIRICLASSDKPLYSLESLNISSDGTIKTNIMNYGESRTLTPFFAEYNTDGSLLSVSGTPKDFSAGGTQSLSFKPEYKSTSVKLFVWDSLSGLLPVDGCIEFEPRS